MLYFWAAYLYAGVWSASEHRCEAERAGESDKEGVYTETQQDLVELIKADEKIRWRAEGLFY